jgi:hypothetical protein
MAGPEDFLDPSLFYQDTPAEQTDPQVEQQDPTVHPAPAEKPDSWVFDEAMLGYPEKKKPTVEEALDVRFYDGSKMGMVEPKPVVKSDDLSEKVVVVCDNGRFVDYAAMLARSFGQVYYHCAADGRHAHRGMIGSGVPQLDVLVDSIWEVDPEKVDLWVFPDSGFGPLQNELRGRGYRVWGAGDWVESNLDGVKAGFEVIQGVNNLRAYLEGNPGVTVKARKWRGSLASFHVRSYREAEARLDLLRRDLGPLSEVVEFIVEKPRLDSPEVSLDGWTVDGAYPKTLFAGAAREGGYVGTFLPPAKIPKPVRTVVKDLAGAFRSNTHRGPYGAKIRIDDAGGASLAGLTGRGTFRWLLGQEMCQNAAEIAWHGADGQIVEPKVREGFGAMVTLKSTWRERNWQPVFAPEEAMGYVRLVDHLIVDGVHYSAPCEGDQVIGCVFGFGATAEEAAEAAEEHAEMVEGPGVEFSEDAVEDAAEAVVKMFG